MTDGKQHELIIHISYLHAEVILEEVDAQRIVLAGVGVAESDLQLAAVARPARGALADVAADHVVAGAAVEAGVAGAVVDVLVAVLSAESLAALALELVVEVEAARGPSRVAEVGRALVAGGLAREADVARSAVAHEALVGVCNFQMDRLVSTLSKS